MTITLHTDHGPLTVDTPCTLDELLPRLLPPGLNPEQLATAVNGQFVPRGQRAQLVLQDADRVLLFSPITGG
ncbi:sulfur carrier protein [Inhella inkyongensis]|uniref:Sulfur carrier protein n=1 Tax=Inhella inkyongensis TaxID=392593 RepID=A0A840S2R5_9BURK|nr:sulfur carrier protein ThiS [Inhella inkyongensis]MBB5202880.1 sulfur carrier protein [Inhella inkyongensis]